MSAPQASPDQLIGVSINGRWRIVEQVGKDGATETYRAEALKGGKPVCVKLLDERCAATRELAARFDRETRAVSRLNHPCCVAILDFGIHRARPYIVTPQVSGRRLAEELGKPQLTPLRAARLAAQILEGLQHGHAHGVIHRDLSPETILLVGAAGAADQVKILDFGLARIVGGDDKRRTSSAAVDLRALGAILRDMVPAGASAGLDRVIARALAAGEDGFADASEMLAALKSTVDVGTSWRRGAEGKRGARRTSIVALALLAVGGGTWWWLRFGPQRVRASSAAVPLVARSTTLSREATPTVPREPPPTAPRETTPTAPRETTPTAPRETTPTAPHETTPTAPRAPAVAAVATLPRDPATAPREPPAPAPSLPQPAPSPPPAARASVAPVTPAVTTAPPPPAPTKASAAVRERVAALLTQGALDEAETLIRGQLETDERAEWHLELAEVFYRRLWRRDTIAQWDRALALDAATTHDPRITTRVCSILGARWNGAGAQLIEQRIGRDALPALVACATSTPDLARLQAAAQLAQRIGGKDALDAQLLSRRMTELAAKPAASHEDAHPRSDRE